jgi:plasmid maintenance system killer protein
LRKLYLEDTSKGLPPDAVDKLRSMLTFLQDMQDPTKLRAFPSMESPISSAEIAKESGACT